ncbi:uncharacterized protein LODBEIA_P02930 [Lodderomyces beijingensis]|uniref:Cell wall mannoprotein PIR1-like C-terminal domain-containing protein n=1 Tax=Lodderomyces beijingensis TaxID=1775926 RepID=A0ABP0ZD11_9ASCO
MLQLSTLILPAVLINLPSVFTHYVPATGDDWTKYRPSCEPLPGSFKTLPFEFGIVVNPYVVCDDGDLREPAHSSIARSLTTTITTSIVTPAPKPTKTKDVILQIQDGQVQKINEELYDKDCEDDRKKVYYDDGGYKDHRDDGYGKHDGYNEGYGKHDGYDDGFKDGSNDRSKGYRDFDKNDGYVDGKRLLKRKTDDSDNFRGDDSYRGGGKYGGKKHRGDEAHNKKHENRQQQPSYNKGGNKVSYEDCEEFSEEDSYDRGRGNKGYYGEDCDDGFVSPVYSVACYTKSTLRMSLKDSILRDCDDRIGCIVSSHQFQFDGPVPQHGAVYAAGWSVTKDGQLALGDSTKFYQCASGHFYNLYDQPIGFQCHPVTLDVVELIEC